MSNEELEQEELDGVEDTDELAVAADADDDIEENLDELPVATKKGKAAVADEETEPHTIEAKQRERDALAKAMDEFFAKGGRVQEIEPNVVADPPKKPESKYGSRPI